ncbi:serine hydrolase [Streptomyces sp. NPDC049881]|uniref:serine hydrolase n=1 Tax=Streptomyces sp. NPDC049881 TaxID=3155778 RepID=UPI003419045E
MSRKSPGASRRFRPALVLNTALATALLAGVVAGDSAREAVESTVGAADRLDGEPPGKDDLEHARIPPSRDTTGDTTGDDIRSAVLPDLRLAREIAPMLAEGPAAGTRLSVAVRALGSGRSAVFGGDSFDTASIAKVDILAALLLLAQDEDRELTVTERTLAEVMIRESDNAAADELWASIGGADGLDAANRRLGLSETTGGPGGHWGLTQTTSRDQLALLAAVYGADSPLVPASRLYVQGLMDTVVDGQRWGVSAAADGSEFQLKNGWLPRTRTGLWDINSIGRVTAGGERYLIAVVSDGHASREAGIAAVEVAAEAAVRALETGRTGV